MKKNKIQTQWACMTLLNFKSKGDGSDPLSDQNGSYIDVHIQDQLSSQTHPNLERDVRQS